MGIIINKTRQLEGAKKAKLSENSEKAYAFLGAQQIIKTISGLNAELEPVDYELLFLLDKETQNDLSTSAIGFLAGIITFKQWTATNGFTVKMLQEDVADVLLQFGAITDPLWEKWGNNLQAINNAETIEELNDITIIY